MKLNSLQDLKCLKPKEVLEEEERQERRKDLSIKALKVANGICHIVKEYYRGMRTYNEYKNSIKVHVNKPKKPKIKELEIVSDYVERHGLDFLCSKNTENDEIFYASELAKVLQKIQSKYIGQSLKCFRTFIRKFI